MIVLVVILAIALIACLYHMRTLSAQVSKAQRSEKMKQAFIHNISHEIRTPLHSVSGMAEVISDESLYLSKSEKRNISDQIKYNAALIATLIDEVLLLSDETTSGHLIEFEEISPNIVCRRCLEASLHQSQRPSVRTTFKRELSDEFFVHTDPHLLELIINKLLLNASRFTQEGEIAIGCNTTDNPDRLTIYVQDTGKGIPEERKSKLFNWFEQPDETRDEAELDLSIVQKLAARINGLVRVDNTYKKGTRMQIILPIR